MSLFNLIARLTLDNSQFRSSLRSSEQEANVTSSRISSAFSKMAKGLVGGFLGFGGMTALINQYRQLGATVEEVQKNAAAQGKKFTDQQAEDVAVGVQSLKQMSLDLLARGAPLFRSAATLAKMALTPGPVQAAIDFRRDYPKAIESALERPEAMERMGKRLQESQENQRKQAEAFAEALAKRLESFKEDPTKYGLKPSREKAMDDQVKEYLRRVAENTDNLNVGL